MTTPEELVEKEIERKRKAVEAQRRYRQRIKEGLNKSLSFTDYQSYRSLYMKEYKANRQKALEEAYKKYDPSKIQKDNEVALEAPYKEKRTRKQVDLSIKQSIPIKKQGAKIKKTVPKWREGLPANATQEQIQAAKKLSPSSISKHISTISVVYLLVLKIPFENSIYFNLGEWINYQTFGKFDGENFELLQWKNGKEQPYKTLAENDV